jgi:hypothetical protein
MSACLRTRAAWVQAHGTQTTASPTACATPFHMCNEQPHAPTNVSKCPGLRAYCVNRSNAEATVGTSANVQLPLDLPSYRSPRTCNRSRKVRHSTGRPAAGARPVPSVCSRHQNWQYMVCHTGYMAAGLL